MASLKPEDAQRLLAAARASFPQTTFTEAWPACLPGFVALKLGNGSVAYMDKSARYLLLGLVFDTQTGKALDRQLEGKAE